MTPDDIKDIPDGALVRLTVEGRLRYEDDECLLIPVDHPYGNLLSKGGNSYATLRMATAIEVLPEPVVEPKRFAVVTDKIGSTYVRNGAGTHPWGVVGGSGVLSWDYIVSNNGPLTVVFEGVDEPAADDYVDRRAAENRSDCTNCGMSDATCTKKVLKGGKACCSPCGSTDTHPMVPREE
jgi:hypothetical protein